MGDAAGFPAHLALALGRDVDAVVLNGSGASGTRRELARRPAPLAGKRVVVWEFAVRELTSANWEVIPLTGGAAPAPVPTGPLLLEGTVVATSRVPRPFSVPYKDCLTYVKLKVDRVVDGRFSGQHVVAVLWAMKDNVLLPAAHYAAGQHLRVEVVPLRQAPVNLQATRVADDLDDDASPPFYVVKEDAF